LTVSPTPLDLAFVVAVHGSAVNEGLLERAEQAAAHTVPMKLLMDTLCVLLFRG
jgi:hypothetical protein